MNEKYTCQSRRHFLGLAGAGLLWPTIGRAEAVATISGTAFGTTWQLVAAGGQGLAAIRPGIEALFADIDRQMSPWRGDSIVSRFNAGPAGWHAADPGLIHVAQNAVSLAEQSGGAFDPTVGPLVARWGFGPIKGGGIPDWRGLSVDSGGIAKARAELTLDLCGIAKGWALDRAVDLARAAGLDNLLFDLGGELKSLGRHSSGRPWRVAVQNLLPGGRAPALLELPSGMAVATTGLRNQSYELAGRSFGHIIDPVTKAPAGSRLCSVSVVAPDAMTADGWATALFAAGHEAGPALANGRGIAALFLIGDRTAPGQVKTGTIDDLLL